MKWAGRFALFVSGAAAIVALLVFFTPRAAPPVTVAFYGTTNDNLGNVLQCFQVRNNMAEDTHGQYAVEVLHNGFWFNALPQPTGTDELTYLPGRSVTYFSVPAPTGRAEMALLVQPDPPGEKWRTYFSYTASRYPRNILGSVMERLSESLGSKESTKGYYAFSPEMSFGSANKPHAADPR